MAKRLTRDPQLAGPDAPTWLDQTESVTVEGRQPLDLTTRLPVPPPPVLPGEGAGGGGGGPLPPTLVLGQLAYSVTVKTDAFSPPPLTVSVQNTGDGTIVFTAVSETPGVVFVFPGSGRTPSVLTLSMLTTGLLVGTRTIHITVSSPDAPNSPQVIVVTLTILPATGPSPPEPPTGPVVAPITKPLWLGYFDIAGRHVPGQPVVSSGAAVEATEGAGNVAVVEGGSDNFTDGQDWRTSQRAALDALRSVGAKLICRAHEDDVSNLADGWADVAAMYLASEGGELRTALETLERRMREIRTRIDGLQLPNRPMLAYFNGGQIDDPSFYVPDGVDWVGVEAYADISTQGSAEAAENYLRAVVGQRLRKLPSYVRAILIGQGYDRNGLWTNAVSLAGMQQVYRELALSDDRVDGILWFAYLRNGGTQDYPDVRAWHEAIYHAAVLGPPPIQTPNFRALGQVTRFDCTQIEGWTFNPSARGLQVQVQTFLGSRHTYLPPDQNRNRISQIVANLPYTDPTLATSFDVSAFTRDSGQHWFRLPIPAAIKDSSTKTLYIYGVSMLDGQQTTLAEVPQTLSCTPTPPPPSTGGELLTMIRADFDSGPFSGITEAPGRSSDAQDAYLDLLVARGYQWCVWCPVSGGTDPPGASAYDGFADPSLLYAWVDKLVARRIVSIVVPFQGAPESWAIIQAQQYTNEWARDNIGDWAREFWDRTGGHFFFMLGFEWNKKFANPDDDYRGPGELWGFNGASSYWAKAIKAAVPQMPVLLHLLPGPAGPTPGEGGRDWTPEGYWLGHGTDDGHQWMDGLAYQAELDSAHNDSYYVQLAQENLAVLHPAGKRCYAGEYVRPGDSFPGSANVGEARGRHIAEVSLATGVDGFMNGGPPA